MQRNRAIAERELRLQERHDRGTGFLATYEDQAGHKACYLITAKHVARKFCQGDVIRMNLNAGGVRDWEMEGIHWQFHPDADIAVAPFTWGSELKVASVDLAYGLTEAKRLEKRVECGDIAYIVGLFRLHHGSKKNIPIVHTGHIAALPDDEELVAVYDKVTGKTARVKAYLIEAQTLDGLSGSPVFVRRGGKALGIQQDSAIHPLGYGAVFLLGVYIASWEAEACEILERDFDIDSNKVRVPVGMGSVATFDQIMDVVNGKELTALRSRQGIAPDQS